MAVGFRYQRAEERFKKMELDRIAAGWDRYGVREIPVSLKLIESRNSGSPTGCFGPRPSAPVDEEPISVPVDAIGVGEIRIASGNTDRIHPSRITGDQLDCAHEGGLPPARTELKMEFAVV